MNTITNLEFPSHTPQGLMNGGGACDAIGLTNEVKLVAPFMVRFWKPLPNFDAVFMERFRNALILYKDVPESVASK